MPLDEVDLEQALASYADPSNAGEPQVLAARVLAAIETRKHNRRWLFGWIIAVPSLACLVLIALLLRPASKPASQIAHTTPNRITTPASAPPVVHSELSGASIPYTKTIIRRTKDRPITKQPPKLDQFPSPAPLTEQEQQLIALYRQVPSDQQQSIAKEKIESDKPLQIAELGIKLLNPDTHP